MKSFLNQTRNRTANFIQLLSKHISQGEINQNSIIIAYYVLLSIFPIIIIIGNVLPLFSIDTKPIARYLELIFPSQVSSLIMPIVNALLKKHSSGYISLGIVVAIWSLSCLVNSIRLGANKIYGVDKQEKGKSWWNYLLARTFTFALSVILVVGFSIIIFIFTFGRQIMEFLAPIFNLSLWWVYKLENYRWPIIILMTVIVNLYINYVIPNIRVQKRVVWPGVWFTVISWSALSYFFGLYLRQFGTRWQNYGIVGSFIIFMLWLNVGSFLLLLGICINAAGDELKGRKIEYSQSPILRIFRKNKELPK